MNDSANKLVLICMPCLLLTACGAPTPRKDLQNLPSLIEIIALDFTQQTIKLRVSHRNRLPKEGNQLSCQLAIKDLAAIKLQPVSLPDLTTFATETVQTHFASELPNLNLEHDNALPYVLDCFLFSTTFSKEHIISKSTVYRIPGEENSYR